jgi:hypothetical protein
MSVMKCRFELIYFYDQLTYLKTIRAKVVMFGIKPKLMKCRFELTYFYDQLTYLKTIRAKVVMFCIKPKLVKGRFEVTFLRVLGEHQLLERRIHDKIIPGFLI